MKHNNTLTITTPSEREIAMTRVFDAPRTLVFEAMTKPELIQRWLLGPDGWTMPVCEVDLRVGGKYRYVWRKEKTGEEMAMGGEFREIVRPERIVATEAFEDAWYSGEAIDTTVLVEKAGKTTMTMTMLLESKEARDGVLASGMESGVSVSYDRLDDVLASAAVRQNA